MFNFVVYSSQLIKGVKGIIKISQKEFVNNEVYRTKILNEVKALDNKYLRELALKIEKEKI